MPRRFEVAGLADMEMRFTRRRLAFAGQCRSGALFGTEIENRPGTIVKSIRRMVEKVHALTDQSRANLNRTLRGWANCFSIGTVGKAYPSFAGYTARRPAVVSVVALREPG